MDYSTGTEQLRSTFQCTTCNGSGELPPTPPATILGKPKKGGGEAKQQYMLEGVRLVEREIEIDSTRCETCGAEDVQTKHRCPLPPRPKRSRRSQSGPADGGRDASVLALVVPREATVPAVRPVARLVQARVRRTRYFWQLPFNPDAPAQVLAYLASRGIEAPIDRKRQAKTTNKKALADLAKQHRDDPFFQLELDWKAVQKVDATYAVGSLNRLDADDRLHPEFVPVPSTFRDACRNPNLQNVVADKAGPDGLASGFRRTVEARDGVPSGVTAEQLAAWEARWT